MSGTVRVSKLNYQYTEKHYISDKIVKCWLRILLWQSFRNYLCENQTNYKNPASTSLFDSEVGRTVMTR